jgi:DNA primase catalytic core
MPASKPRRRERTPAQRAAAQQARTDRLEALHQQLAAGVEAIRDGQAWADWLSVASRLHSYSFNNQILIAMQKPQARMVAGYGAWQAMGRQVRKGEKAIWILAPVTRRARTDADGTVDGDDLAGSAPAPDPATTGAGQGRGAVVGFRGAGVFDVSQTDGDPIPTPPSPQLLEGHAPPGLWDSLSEVITARGFTVTRCASAAEIGGANGLTDYGTRAVTVRGDVDDAQAVKTLAHEAGHVLLHDPADRGAGPVCRDLIEVEAESVAYLVAAHHGLDTGDYTFAYIAGWAGRDNEAITRTARRVLDTARTLIAATDPTTTPDQGVAVELAATARAQATAAQATATAAEATRHRLAAALHPGSDRLRVLLLDAQTWFQAQAAQVVFTEAVTARGYTPAQALGYGLGYAPASWTGLVDHLRDRGHPDTDLLAAGVAVTARHGRLIDRFRARITFPIHDSLGVVGFTARDTTGHPDAPKYLNTPASDLYDKSRLLFGTQHLPTGSHDPQTITTVVLAEGPWDALAVTHAGGGDTVGVAACGTAVTEAHLDLALGRGRGRDLVLAPDNDPAGTAALGRTLAMLAQRGARHPHAVRITTGKDLADLHTTGGPTAVTAALAGARPGGIVYADAHLADHPADTPEARVAAARAAAAHTAGLTLGQRADLGALLISRAGIGAEAALALVTPQAAPAPKPVAAAVPARPALAAARTGLRR